MKGNAKCIVIAGDPNVGHLESIRLLDKRNMNWCNQDGLVTRGSERIAVYVLQIATTLSRYRVMFSTL